MRILINTAQFVENTRNGIIIDIPSVDLPQELQAAVSRFSEDLKVDHGVSSPVTYALHDQIVDAIVHDSICKLISRNLPPPDAAVPASSRY